MERPIERNVIHMTETTMQALGSYVAGLNADIQAMEHSIGRVIPLETVLGGFFLNRAVLDLKDVRNEFQNINDLLIRGVDVNLTAERHVSSKSPFEDYHANWLVARFFPLNEFLKIIMGGPATEEERDLDRMTLCHRLQSGELAIRVHTKGYPELMNPL